MRLIYEYIMVFIAGLGYCILFNVRGYRLIINAFGAVLAYALYLLAFRNTGNVFWSYLIATSLIAVLCEALARITHTPTTLMIVPMIVPPLIPGGDLYNTFYSLFLGEMGTAFTYGMRLALEIGAINIGIIFGATLVRLWHYIRIVHRRAGKLRA
ncbi:MAG: threonine/serine exporter family protein [Eubacteriales bacterium]|nr:threonine/serine exporter family protein [Eubacteriales bacterium]